MQSEDVMLQGFYWDSYTDTKWTNLESQATEISQNFDLLWLPPSGNDLTPTSMGYLDVYWFDQNSSFGTQAELKSLISTLKSYGTRCIADIVINHRNGVSNWVNFPEETYNGVIYTPNMYWICSTDECKDNGYTPLGNADEGEDFNGGRDLDHQNWDLQACIKAYLDFMKNEMGYDGWRYDMTKGYSGYYNGVYNDAAGAYYSVGEYWDASYDALYAWLQNADFKSTTFDFAFKYALNNWASTGDLTKIVWAYLGTTNQPAGLIHNPEVRRYATTFIDNHDTYRDYNKFSGDVLMANALMLSSPGIPCVFLSHWKEYKSQIKPMIAARKKVQLHSQSPVVVNQSAYDLYVATATGKSGELIVKLGSGNYTPPSDFVLETSGNNYAIWTKVVENTPIIVRFKAPSAWTQASVYLWENNGTTTELAGSWPGTSVPMDAEGYYTYTVSNYTQTPFNVIFNNSGNGEQTVDMSTSTNACWEYGSTYNNNGNTYYNATLDPSCTIFTTNKNLFVEEALKIYPNPVTRFLKINTREKISKISLRTIYGSTILEKTVSGFSDEINMRDYPSGVYIVTMRTAKGHTISKSIIKK